MEKYGHNIDLKQVELSFRLNNDDTLYKEKVLEVSKYKNMIPVISVKQEFDIPKKELEDFINKLQNKCDSIALRITENWIEKYKDLIEQKLREKDFLFFDIEEQNPETKFMEIDELNELDINAQIVLINSPRKQSVKNGEYPEHDETDLINNSARKVAGDNELAGYGDYCGLKDQLPMTGGAASMGAALALFYDFDKNIFYSYSNHDTSLGTKGYYKLIPIIKNDKDVLDPFDDCPGFKMVEELQSSGNWSTWHHINAVRYIDQTFRNI